MLERIKANWEAVLSYIKENYDLSGPTFNSWINPLEPYKLHKDDNGKQIVDLLVPEDIKMFVSYIQRKYNMYIAVAIEEITGINCSVDFVTKEDLKEKKPDNVLINNGNNTVSDEVIALSNLNPKYTFDTFVVGKSNNIAHAASLAVAESPGEMYNPLFIYGDSGLGKTHLMQAIAHFVLNKDPDKKVLYAPSEPFTNEIVEALKNKDTDYIRKKYRNNDIFLLDDFQFLIGKDATQLEFFNIFNSMVDANRQVIITSDRPPKDFTDLDKRMSSRLSQGLIVDIQSPDYETRMAILRKKEETENYNIDNEVLKYIAENIKSNIRELEGALTKVIAMSRLDHNKEINVEFAKEVLKDNINPVEPAMITPETVLDVVCDHFNVSKEDILGSKRNKELVYPRQISMYLLRELTNCTHDYIGNILGGRDHSTVIHGIDKISTEIKTNKELQNIIIVLKKKLSTN